MKNIYPTDQISDERRRSLEKQIEVLSSRYGVSITICKDIFRVGYESAWDDCLNTEKPSTYSRLTDNLDTSTK